MIPQLQVQSRGFFEFEIKNGNGETVKRSEAPAKNLLLDGFFTNIANTAAPLTNGVIRCGTGSTTRTTGMSALVSQLTLQSGSWPLASVTHAVPAYDAGTNSYIGISTYVSTFAVGQIVGNVAEWGIEFNNVTTATRNVVHASSLVKDGNGNPTTIQVLSTEQLIVTYKLETRLSAVDYTSSSSVVLDSVQQVVTCTGRWGTPVAVNNYYGPGSLTFEARTGPLNAHGTALGGTQQGTKTGTIVTGGASKIFRCSLLVSDWNFGGGIAFIGLNNSMVKYEFNPPLTQKIAGRTAQIDLIVNYGRLP